jgi:hypothetical protein
MATLVSSSPSPTGSATATSPPSLCLSVTHPSGTVQPGKPAQFTVQVWAENWTSGKVQILLSGPTPSFTNGCPTGNKTASCTLVSPGSTPTKLQAQLTVQAGVSQVTLKAVVQPATVNLPQPLTVSDTVHLTSSTAAATAPGTTPVGTDPAGSTAGSLPAIPLPPLTNSSSSVLSPGNAAGLFPAITPSGQPSTALASSPPAQPSSAQRNTNQAQSVSVLPVAAQTLTAQVAGLIALALALVFVFTRLPRLRRRKH